LSTAKKILLVDDEPGLRQLLQTTLDAPEFAIAQAGTGEQALTLARRLQPDLIILDMQLTPEHPNGLEVCRELKNDPATAGSRILMLTGTRSPEGRGAAEAAGVDYYFTKPFSPRTLLDQIYKMLLG
jgi:DNA-binding response OmpR family regulator